jgi:general stress protein 26
MKKYIRFTSIKLMVFSVMMLIWPMGICAQDHDLINYERDTLISVAKGIMEATRYCALVTLDNSGHPQVRTMDPFMPENDMVVWLGTNINSRKVSEIRNDSRVTLYYEAPNGTGYVVVQGNASLIDDPKKLTKYWKEEWESFYPDKDSTYMLIKVIPEKLEIIDYMHGITGSSKTWKVPYVDF